MQLVPGVHNQDRFPGSQPTALERNKIKVLQTGKYWISEKSDGLRYVRRVVVEPQTNHDLGLCCFSSMVMHTLWIASWISSSYTSSRMFPISVFVV